MSHETSDRSDAPLIGARTGRTPRTALSAFPGETGRSRSLLLVALVTIGCTLAVVAPATGATAQPSPASSYYGTIGDENGNGAPPGTTVVAVVAGDVVDEVTGEVTGEYGGPGPYEAKLRAGSDATEVEFYLGGPNGTRLSPVDSDPEAGVHEWNLTAPDGTFAGDTTDNTSRTGANGPSFAVSGLSQDPAEIPTRTPTNVSVTATIENTGNRTGTRNVTWQFAASTLADRQVELAPNESTAVEFTAPINRSAGTYDHGIRTANDAETTTLTVTDSSVPVFTVSGLSQEPAEIPAGTATNLTVTATVENTGNRTDTRTVTWQFAASTLADRQVELAPNESTAVEFTAPINRSAGTYDHDVRTANGSRTATLTVTRTGGPVFAVSGLSQDPAEIPAGTATNLTVTATVENTGDRAAMQRVTWRLAGAVLVDRQVELAPDESTAVEFTAPINRSAGTYDHDVRTANDSRSATLTVTGRGETAGNDADGTAGESDRGTATTAGSTPDGEVASEPGADDGSTDGADGRGAATASGTPRTEPQTGGDDGFGLPLTLGGGLVVVLALVGAIAARRFGIGPSIEEIRNPLEAAVSSTEAVALIPMLSAASTEGTTGKIGIRNESDRDLRCRVRCQTRSEREFLEETAVAAGDGTSLGSVPDEAFEVAVAVENGPTAKQVYRDPPEAGHVVVRFGENGVRID